MEDSYRYSRNANGQVNHNFVRLRPSPLKSAPRPAAPDALAGMSMANANAAFADFLSRRDLKSIGGPDVGNSAIKKKLLPKQPSFRNLPELATPKLSRRLQA